MTNIIKSGLKSHKTLAAITLSAALMVSMPNAIAADTFNGSVKGVIKGTDNIAT